MGLLLALLLPAQAVSPDTVTALRTELERSTTELRLGEEGPPWFVAYDLIEGDFATYYAEFGALLQDFSPAWTPAPGVRPVPAWPRNRAASARG